ncbi:response regulator [Anatilimnocola sp. NA78]|uniref:response regulator n=1 Tax=Anatilimnocola sp. NA78 TaxID=3415683 RepID=UPI003CE573F3
MSLTRKLNLILVDDDAAITRLAERFIASEFSGRLNMQVFNDARLAKEAIDANSCDILLSDIQMPQVNGLQMLKYAKQRNSWTQVVFMTAHSTWDYIAEAMEIGATDYLLKPLERRDLIHVLEQTCDRVTRWQQVVRATWQRPATV